MAEEQVPRSWINTSVALYVERGPMASPLTGTLVDANSEGVTLRRMEMQDQGEELEVTDFYPWTSFYRLRQL